VPYKASSQTGKDFFSGMSTLHVLICLFRVTYMFIDTRNSASK
jgi:hypothetical protein